MVSPRPSLELHSFSCKFACWVVGVFVLGNPKASLTLRTGYTQVTMRTEEKIEVICRHKAFLRTWLEFTDNKDELVSYRFLFFCLSPELPAGKWMFFPLLDSFKFLTTSVFLLYHYCCTEHTTWKLGAWATLLWEKKSWAKRMHRLLSDLGDFVSH